MSGNIKWQMCVSNNKNFLMRNIETRTEIENSSISYTVSDVEK